MALSRVLSPVLIGRDAELSALEDALLSTLRGDGGVVIVGGEAGMGKTRLVNALAARARRLGCVVIAGGCSEAELSLPYLPFLEAIGNYLATADIAGLRERLGPAAEELAHLFPHFGRSAPSSGDPSQAKLRLFESILMLLRDAASKRALLVILEDLQWADPATRELLDYSTRRLRTTNVLIAATYRTDEMHRKHALLPTIQGWRRNGLVETVDLTPLNAPQVADMVCAIFEEEKVSDEFRDFLRERSEGNPFVLEEMLRDALDRGDIFQTADGWDRKTLAEIRIPPTVRDTILQRLERLGRDDVAVLSAASVMGRSFDLASLAEVAREDEAVTLAALETAVTAQLIEQEDRTSGRYRFRHALTREAIYEDMVVPRRQQLHSRVADVMTSGHGGAAVDIANHLFMAGRNEEAVAMSLAAAEEAVKAFAFRDAAELLERAAPHIRDAVERARVLCRAADAYWNNTETPNAKRLLEAAIPDLEAAGLHSEAALQRLLLGRCWWELLRSDLAREQFEKARDVLAPAGPSEGLAIAYIRLGSLLSWNGEVEQSEVELRRALEIAEAAGADLARVWALIFLGGVEAGLGQVEVGFRHLDDGYAGAVAGNYRFQVFNVSYNATWIALHLGLGEMVDRWHKRVEVALRTTTDAWPVYIKALIELAHGRVPDAISDARLALQRARDSGHQKMVWRSSVLLAHALAENARGEEALAVLPPVSTRVDLQDKIYDTAPRVHTRLANGDWQGALDDARTVEPRDSYIASPADVMAEVIADAGELRAFLGAAAILGEVAQSPRILSARGRLALLDEHLDESVDLLGQAQLRYIEGGLLLDGWHAGRALAEAHFRRGDREAARELFQTVVDEARAAGALLAARLASETASKLGIEVHVAASRDGDRPVVTHVQTGERMVSVVFADVRGYSRLSGTTSPADLTERIGSLQRWATQEVERRHGIVDKFAGDAVMATFNVSGQSIDHAVDALRAAIAIIDKAALAELPVGAAVAVGPAVVGNLSESANLSVLGEVTNLASRLQSEAAAGEVMLTEEAHRRVREWLETHHVPAQRVELSVKGFGDPIVAYRVTAGLTVPA